jgi:hypothetical protein
MRKYGYLVQQIEKALSELGAMTGAEFCQELGVEKAELSAVVSRMAKASKTLPKRLYIVGYTFEHETHDRRYPRAIYALGDLPDKPKPKPSRIDNVRRYTANKRKRLTGNSVFNLGLPRRIYDQSRSQSVVG